MYGNIAAVLTTSKTMQIGRILAMVRTSRDPADKLGNACVRSLENKWNVYGAAIGAGVWIEFEQGDGLSDLGGGALGLAGRCRLCTLSSFPPEEHCHSEWFADLLMVRDSLPRRYRRHTFSQEHRRRQMASTIRGLPRRQGGLTMIGPP